MNKALWEKAMAEFATSWTAMAASSSPAILVTSSTPLSVTVRHSAYVPWSRTVLSSPMTVLR
jgi:hypothetical protein